MDRPCRLEGGDVPFRDVLLGEVQETLLVPLYMRALETRRADAICRDAKACEIVASLNYDFSRFVSDTSGVLQLDIAIRTEILDEATVAFLARHPRAQVVNLGAGLDNRFQRLDNGQVCWWDLDLPDAIALRRGFYEESARNRFVSRSIFDEKWFDELGQEQGRPTLLIAEGLFPYLEPEQVQGFFRQVATRLPGAEMLFQTISPRFINQQHIVPAVNQTKAVFKWGIRSGQEVALWDARYELVDEWAYIDRHRDRWEGVLRRWWFVPGIENEFREVMKITHMRFRG